MTLTSMKFRVVDAAHSRAIQEKLFEQGYCWWNDRANKSPQLTTKPYLYADDDSSITYSDKNSRDFFEDQSNIEYLLHRGELVEAGGSNPTFEEQQEKLLRPWVLQSELSQADFSGIEAHILGFNECSLPQPQHFVDVPEVENVGKRQHVLRSWSMFFQGIIDGDRTSDIRWTGDRHFIVGDYLLLQEYDSAEQCYTGREQRVQITYIQQNKSNPCAISHLALADDYAVLSIKLC